MDASIAEFIIETSEGLIALDQELLALERNPKDTSILGNIFRVIHTIKGSCGFVGLSRLGKLAHATENVLSMMRDGELEATPYVVTSVLESLDTIKSMVDYLAQHGKESEEGHTALIARLNDFVDGKLQPVTQQLPAPTNSLVPVPVDTPPAVAIQPRAPAVIKIEAQPKTHDPAVLVVMRVDQQRFGIPAHHVREVQRDQHITPVPQAPDYIAGSMNLRGGIVTVLNFRKRLGLTTEYSARPMFLGVEYRGELFSILVDKVESVQKIPDTQIEKPPFNLAANWREISTGVCRMSKDLLLIIDMHALLAFQPIRNAS